MLRDRIAKARPRTVLAIAWLALFLYGFPGQMQPDTFGHLVEARTGVYTDASPPVFTVLFAISDWSFGGQVLVFLLQTTAFVAGAFLTFRRLGLRQAHWWTLGFVVFPPTITTLALVWKDALMPGLLLLGFASILDERRWVRLLALLALFGAIAIRYNAFAAAAPLVVLLFQWRPGLHWLKRYAIAVVAWLAITFAAYQANAVLTDRHMHFWHASIALFDIAGVLKHSGPIPDAELAPLLENTGLTPGPNIQDRILAKYRARNFFHLIAGQDRVWTVPIRGIDKQLTLAQREAIAHAWTELVTKHPGAYLIDRADVFRECLALRGKTRAYQAVPDRTYPAPADAHEAGVATHASRLQKRWTAAYAWLWRSTPIFEPFVYFVLSLVLLPLAWRHRDILALVLSGIAIELTLFVLAPSPDFRYSHWMVLSTVLSVIALVARRRQR